MARHVRVPALLWKTVSGKFTLSLINFESNHSIAGENRDDLIWEMSEYLQSYAEEHGAYSLESDLEEISIRQFNVSAPSQYEVAGRIHHVAFETKVRIPGIVASQGGVGYLCCVPALGLQFDFFHAGEERGLAQHFIKSALQVRSPRELATMFCESDAELVDVSVRLKDKSTGGGGPDDFKFYSPLSQIAEPIVRGRGLRARYPSAWGRELIVSELVKELEEGNRDILIVGEPGTGKTTMMIDAGLQLAERRGERAKPLCWRTSAHRLISGMRYLGQWQERCEQVVAKLNSFNGILCLEDLISLVRVGGTEPGSSIAAFLMTYMSRGELRVMAEATPAELDACRRLLPGFADLFLIVRLPRLTPEQVVSILQRVAESTCSRLKVEVGPGADKLHNALFERYLSYEVPPGRVVRSFRSLLERTKEQGLPKITAAEVTRAFVRETGLPLHLLDDTQPLDFNATLRFFHARIIGQDTAGETAAHLVARLKAGLNDPERPIAVLLFCGPTGTGKTAMARTIAECLFGAGDDKDRLIRLDMSEYAGYDAVTRLLGTPGGEPSSFLRRVRQQPFQVILFDEIEKAAPPVYDLLLNLFDVGRIRDADGRETWFRSSILIMTSNLGVTGKSTLGFGEKSDVNYEREALRFFRPEFVNRIDEVVSFAPLTAEVIRSIAENELRAICLREGLAERGIRLEWDSAILEKVSSAGFDPRYGARPLQRAVEEHAAGKVALYLSGHPATRNCILRIGADGNVVVL